MKIIIDGMGGDNAPVEVVKGTVQAVEEYGISAIIVGKEEILKKELDKYDYNKKKIEILNANDIITNEDEPALAIRRKKESSMVVGLKKLNEGIGDGFISAGNTGALLAGGLFIVKRIEGIERAALTTMYPTIKGISLLVDAGANIDCKPEFLNQFATMASIYMENAMGRKNPTVGLVNVGKEQGKGNQLSKDSFELLKNSNINFIGNIEGRDVPYGEADIIVCDGFVGNVLLKVTEGVAMSLFSQLKQGFTKNAKTKLAASLLKTELKELKSKTDYREYGGAPLLGTKKPIVKAHGSSDAYAIKNGIKQLIDFIDMNVIKIIEDNIQSELDINN